MNRPPYLSIIVSASESARTLPLRLIEIDREMASSPFRYEIIVVDDASSDNTLEISKRFEPIIKNLKVIPNPEQTGIGGAVRIGIRAANGLWRVAAPVDSPFSIQQFISALEALGENQNSTHILYGSRTSIGGHARIMNAIFRLILGSRIHDLTSGLFCISDKIAEEVFSQLRISTNGFALEAVRLAEHMGYAVTETPITIEASPITSNYLQILFETIKIRWWLLRGIYK